MSSDIGHIVCPCYRGMGVRTSISRESLSRNLKTFFEYKPWNLKKQIIIIHMVFTEWLQTYVPITLGILSILGIILGFIAQVTKKFQKLIKDEVTEMAKEFKPNGGGSIKDQVTRLEKSQIQLEKKVDTIINFIINNKE